MSHFAKVLDGKVIQVIVAEKEFFDIFVDTSPGNWIQTSYNTKGNVHYNSDNQPDNGAAFGVSLIMNMRAGVSFLAGFWGIAIFWYVTALMRDIPNDHILSSRMAVLFHLSDYGLLPYIVALLGGVVGGLAAMAAAYMRPRKQKKIIAM